jgi:molecular chaperone DnaK
MLTKQSLQPKDIKFTLMVGGSTFIPFVRTQVEEMLGIPVNTSIDPTNAIVAGAAYYASNKPVCINTDSKPSDKANSLIKIKASYQHNSQEDEELFAAKVTGETQGMTYRISRTDGGFDTGIKQLTAKIQEDLPLIASEYNIFTFDIFNAEGSKLSHNCEQLQISQGLYSVAGQMLPFSLHLVKDVTNKNTTVLDCIFQKNCILPTRVRRTVEVARTVYAGNTDADNKISIILVEGEHSHYLANKPIGTLEITGSMIPQDLLAGEDIDLTFAISESRDFTVSADLPRLDKNFTQVFNPKKSEVITAKLAEDIDNLEIMIEDAQDSIDVNNDINNQLEAVRTKVVTLQQQKAKLTDDAVTDEKFQLEDQQRQLAAEAQQLISQQQLEVAKKEYLKTKDEVTNNVKANGNPHEHELLQEIISMEKIFLSSNNIEGIKAAILQFEGLDFQIKRRNPDFIQGVFLFLVKEEYELMTNKTEANNLILQGKQYLENSDWQNLSIINSRLWDLVPDTKDKDAAIKMITGIV